MGKNDGKSTRSKSKTPAMNECTQLLSADVRGMDGGWGWLVVLGAGLMHFLLVGTARSLGIIYVVLRERFHSSATETAIVAAVFNTTRSLSAPLFSTLCDKFGCRKVAIVGSLVLSLGVFISAFASSIFFLYFSFGLLAGTGGAMVFTAGYVIVSQYFDKKKGKAMAFATLGSGVGNVVLSPAISALVDEYGFSGSMIILSSLMLNNFISAALYWPLRKKRGLPRERIVGRVEEGKTDEKQAIFIGDKTDDAKSAVAKCDAGGGGDNDSGDRVIILPDKGESLDVHKQTEHAATATATDSGAPVTKASTTDDPDKGVCVKYKRLLCNPTFLLYGYQIMCMQVCIPVYLIFLPDFALEHGTDRMHAAFILSVMGISDMVGRIFFGFVFDLERVRRHQPKLHSVFGIAFGLATACVIFMPSFRGMLVTAIVVGLTESAVHSQRATIATQLVSPLDMSGAIGLMIFSQGLGNIWGPPVAGALRDVTGTSAYCFVFAGLVLASSSLLFLVHYSCTQRSRHRTKRVDQ